MNDYVQYAGQAGALDPQAVDELQAMAQGGNSEAPDLLTLRDAMGWPARDIHTRRMTIRNQIIDGHVNVRIYRCDEDKAPTPGILFLHGGGFFGGSLDNVEYPCRSRRADGSFRRLCAGPGASLSRSIAGLLRRAALALFACRRVRRG